MLAGRPAAGQFFAEPCGSLAAALQLQRWLLFWGCWVQFGCSTAMGIGAQDCLQLD